MNVSKLYNIYQKFLYKSQSKRMKIEDLLFAMCDDNNDYLDDANSSIKCGSHESDEGCCIINTHLLSPQSAVVNTVTGGTTLSVGTVVGGGGEPIRRVKSTPNLLQIPSPSRHRKRSDDSAVGSSAEENDSYKSNDSLPTAGGGSGDPSPSKKIYSSYRHSCPHDSSASSASSTASSSFKNPSCIAQQQPHPHHHRHHQHSHHNLRILTPNFPLFVTEGSGSSVSSSEKFRRSVSANACSSGGRIPCGIVSGGGNCLPSKRVSLSSCSSSFQLSPPGRTSSSITYTSSCSSLSSTSAIAATTPTSSTTPVTSPTTPTSAGIAGHCNPLEGKLLRPPSVVISDHDLCQEEGETFITLEELDAEFSEQQQHRRRFSDCSTCSSLSFSESDLTTLSNEDDTEEAAVNRVSKWKKVQTYFHHVTPFIQTYKNQASQPWIQLAGHQGNFKSGRQHGTILKKLCTREQEALEILMNDTMKPFVPKYYGQYKDEEGNEFIELEDLLGHFTNPCVMDCKIGVRTYLEEELMKAKEKPKLRKDMYEKMYLIDPNAPTPEEHHMRGVTKPRYMVWRETISTTATLGFRIEGIRRNDGTSSKDFKTMKSENQVKDAFFSFVNVKGASPDIIKQYLERLYELKVALAQSQFFASHEVIGSSLLFVHDSTKASVWMIDFAKTCPLPEECTPISHDKPWALGNHEDGYLIGLSNLIKFFEDMINND